MNREILFKAKRKDNGEWVEGYYVKTRLGTDIKPSDVIFVPFKMSRNEEWGWMKIDPTTICQYTGLTDKNGWKIWENDIVIDKDNDYYKVFWNKNLCNYSLECIKTEHLFLRGKRWDLYLFVQNDTLKVIENIFDNSELLEV